MNTGRRNFVRQILFGGSAFVLSQGTLFAQQKSRPAPYNQELVKEFVVAGHNNLTKVKTLLAEYHNLLNCNWDWGGGVFEMAIGGAGHVGNKEIKRGSIT